MHLITIFKLALAGLITLTSALPTEAVAAKSAQDLVKVLDGFISFDEDGVLRSIDGNNQVIGYYQLNPAQIATMINTMPVGSNKTAMTEAFAGIDGTKVTGMLALISTSEYLIKLLTVLQTRLSSSTRPRRLPPTAQKTSPSMSVLRSRLSSRTGRPYSECFCQCLSRRI